MIRVLGDAAAVATGSVVGVLERAVAGGAPAPSWLAVEDPGGAWVRAIAVLPAAERARGVVAVSTEAALVAAARLEVGGALWLPPSLAGAVTALEAAAAVEAGRASVDLPLAELVAPASGELVAVVWANRRFWRHQVGEQEMARLLAALAEALGVVPAVLPWPALILEAGGPTGSEIDAAWRRLTSERRVLSEGVECIACGRPQDPGDSVAAATRALAADRTGCRPDPSAWGFPRPVHELPSGGRVGWWSPAGCAAEVGGEEWTAMPGEATAVGFRWQLQGAGRLPTAAVDTLGTVTGPAAAVRVPGWIAAGLGAGRPAGLLVERFASAAQRLGVPLWVPNVGAGALRYLLRLPGTLWVDGAAVPEGA